MNVRKKGSYAFTHFSSKINNLQEQIKKEKIIANMQCTMCKKTFKHIGNLRQHFKSHEGNKNHECPTCKKKRRLNIRRHQKTRHQSSGNGISTGTSNPGTEASEKS